MQRGEPVENLVSIEVYPGEKDKTVHIGLNLKENTKLELVNLLRTYADIFAWTAADMPEIDPELSVIKVAVKAVLVREEDGVQKSIYYVNKYKSCTIIKAQALADFIVEYTLPKDPPQLVISEVLDPWNLYVDGSSAVGINGVGIILISSEASNNEAEYEALLMGIRLAHALKVDSLSVHSDFQLVVNHVLGDYEARDERMAQYLQLVKTLGSKFKNFTIRQIPQDRNTQADKLSRLASAEVTDIRCSICLEFLKSVVSVLKLRLEW
ncbi:hypothetical protein RJ639_044748 [Escallonia herrerae]|uniref:RNase H type-1 domain-containing protein n=1 Tax=Escallonia herrerae TaxID=1293975 RepID=A0AA88WCZ2_9ASTE|nr:hypothetical protein RJ639_044748 [Escallonia herrerae]